MTAIIHLITRAHALPANASGPTCMAYNKQERPQHQHPPARLTRRMAQAHPHGTSHIIPMSLQLCTIIKHGHRRRYHRAASHHGHALTGIIICPASGTSADDACSISGPGRM